MSYDPRTGYGHMEQWRTDDEVWIGTFETLDYPFQGPITCPKCGGKTEWWEGQTDEEWDGSPIYQGCNECRKCRIHDQWWYLE